MKISSLKQQVKNPERVSVFVDGKYAFSLSLDELVNEKLKNDQELSPAELKRLKKLSADGKLRIRTLAWLLNRSHSERELRDYLRRKKAEAELSDRLVEEFTKRDYLNDDKYAQWLTELRSRGGKSNRAIRSELYLKGISREVIDEVLEAGGNESERLKALIAKKRRASRYKNDELKLAKYLVSQGFSYGLVKETLRLQNPEI